MPARISKTVKVPSSFFCGSKLAEALTSLVVSHSLGEALSDPDDLATIRQIAAGTAGLTIELILTSDVLPTCRALAATLVLIASGELSFNVLVEPPPPLHRGKLPPAARISDRSARPPKSIGRLLRKMKPGASLVIDDSRMLIESCGDNGLILIDRSQRVMLLSFAACKALGKAGRLTLSTSSAAGGLL
jgi:hypothetical protein